jgi:thioredoxin-dependent peroxiredoxin
LADYRGRWLVLYFYPKDATPVCTREACNLRDGYGEFQARDVALLGVSLDDANSHTDFAQRHDLPFPLLTDTNAAVARAYGSLSDFLLFRFAKRHTFLIDPNGCVAKVYQKIDAEQHAQGILHDLNQLGVQRGVVASSSGANNSPIPPNP